MRRSISVIMPARNAAVHIGAALASLTRQNEAAAFDVIVVDDGSTDATAEIAREAGGPVRVISGPGRGIAAARNAGLEAAEGEFISFLDADDISPKARFARDLKLFEDDPALEVQYGFLRVVHDIDPATLEPEAADVAVDVRGMQLGAGIFRKALIDRVGRFDTDFTTGEDMDFLLRIFEAEPEYLLTEDICVYYRRHETNTSRDLKLVQRGYMQALMKSARRRKGRPAFHYPADLFDGSNLAKMRGL